MSDPLTDESGFPRNDIDVYQVRHARQQIICLQNDLKQKMKEIEKGLEIIHAESRDTESSLTTRKLAEEHDNERFMIVDSVLSSNDDNRDLKSIVKVNLVSPMSPAELSVSFISLKVYLTYWAE